MRPRGEGELATEFERSSAVCFVRPVIAITDTGMLRDPTFWRTATLGEVGARP